MYARHSLRIIRKSGPRQAAQARRLIAASGPAPYVLAATQEFPEYNGQKIVEFQAIEAIRFGFLVIPAGATYYLLSSRVGYARFYAACQVDDKWKCSCDDADVLDWLSQRMNVYTQSARGELL